MTTVKVALIAGASGLTGSYCLDFLLNEREYSQVISVGRKNLQKQHPKLKQIIADPVKEGPDQISDLLQDIEFHDVFCCLGSTMKKAGSKDRFMKVDFDYPVLLANIAKIKGAFGFHVVSAMGADKKSFFFYNRVKGMMEEAIMKLEIPNTNILRPSIIDGERTETRTGEKIGLMIAKIISPLLLGPLKKYKPTKAKAIGYALVEMAARGIKGLTILDSEQIENLYKKKK
jgi:uncharacterized protein YbjT (DUF2867 family)